MWPETTELPEENRAVNSSTQSLQIFFLGMVSPGKGKQKKN